MKDNDDTATVSPPGTFPIVGIGASAGGIEALKRFFPAVRPDSGLCYVVIQHLSPDYPSTLDEIIGRSSPLPVIQIDQDTTPQPDHVYIIPPKASLTLEDGRLHLAPPKQRLRRLPIDDFLISLAQACGEKAACAILSGVGSDGTLGLRAIKEHGGLTLAQEEAQYEGMMRSAVGTGLVDFVLSAEEMAEKLQSYFDRRRAAGTPGKTPQVENGLARICQLLRRRTGHDFSNYKEGTVSRRVQRRMHVLQIDTIAEFADYLHDHSDESHLLLQDLLIGVTEFFRDPDAFTRLATLVIPKLFEDKGDDDTVRVWVPGCSTGEEAYSLAILLHEGLPKGQRPKLQIFATDIDERALDMARLGRYPASIAQTISDERLKRHFQREDGTYRVSGDLRQICLFSPHNILRDAPFSRLDLISCRNLLIYLNADLQNRVLPLFHYALRNDGFLFLGSSENVTRHSRLFTPVDKSHRIYQRRLQEIRKLPEFPLTSATPAAPRQMPAMATIPSLHDVADRQILDQFAPAYVIVNEEGDVLHALGRTGKYLELPAGAPDHNLFSMARRGLRLDLRTAVHSAVSTGESSLHRGVTVDTEGGRQTLDIVAQPLRHSGFHGGLFLVVFRDVGEIVAQTIGKSQEKSADTDTVIQQLEAELHLTRQRLQTSTEELESSNEELKSANEELSSMNEELQSANEELETSKEELQSVNEELQTVNEELNNHIEELNRTHNDMVNLLASTQIATIFLDRDLKIQSFTPSAKDLYRLVESDMGRVITHVRACFELNSIEEDAQRVLRSLGSIQRQITCEGGARYAMRILPYRTVTDTIAGVVLTFTDITRLTEAEARAEELAHDRRIRLENLETLVDLIPIGIFFVEDGETKTISTNLYGAGLLGEGAVSGRGLKRVTAGFRLFSGDEEIALDDQPLQRATRGEPTVNFEARLVREDGSALDVMISASPLFNEAGKPRGAVVSMADMTHHQHAAAHQKALLHELQHRVKNILATVASMARQTRNQTAGPEEFLKSFLARLQGMSRTHSLLWKHGWEGTALRDLCGMILEPYAQVGGNVSLHGPAVRLRPSAATSLGMILQELTTNAVKYGALSAPEGHVDITWDIREDGKDRPVELLWSERGGPPALKPSQAGFGTNFISGSIGYELAGTADIEYRDNGLRCGIVFPQDGNVETEQPQPDHGEV